MQEHKCVLDSCRAMENEGFRVTYLPVQNNGVINLNVSGSFAAFTNWIIFMIYISQELEAALTRDTAIVSIMTVNNEIGVRQPVEEIGKTSPSHHMYVNVKNLSPSLPQVSFAGQRVCSSTLMLHR